MRSLRVMLAVVASTTVLLTGAAVAQARGPQDGPTTYQFDPAHTSINFAVRHLVINTVRGRFHDFTGTIAYDPKDVTKSTVEFTAKIASIDTDVPPRDEDLRSPNFFDAAKYPEMTFKSSKVTKSDVGFIANGTLTIKGVSKEISIPFQLGGPIKDPWGNDRLGVTAELTINRQEYGITYDQKLPDGGLAVGNDVHVNLDVEAVHKPAK